MRIVLDINTLLSAFFWRGLPRAVFDRVADGFDTLFITGDIIDEIESVIKRPKFDGKEDRKEALVADIRKYGQKASVSPQHRAAGACRDAADDKILECALAAKADCIITGDKDLLVLKAYNGIKIMTAKEYLDTVTPA
ncbi:MAG: putative toxin-antitoxin system toxin component, PIN family [Chitinispirillia bacterium]|nr:putative toxin-antitoxin system toxin component, PIN family [Chitinispirillia bacterium]MCL2242396.1 putative toxin-antitoxin system toxin component, PIN family [Chitinispirillia bacterium]